MLLHPASTGDLKKLHSCERLGCDAYVYGGTKKVQHSLASTCLD